MMKKLLGIVVLGLLFSVNAKAENLNLTCVVDDGSFSDSVTIYVPIKTAEIKHLNNVFQSIGSVEISPDSYDISGSSEGIADYRYIINRTTGRYNASILYKKTGQLIQNSGSCQKVSQKF